MASGSLYSAALKILLTLPHQVVVGRALLANTPRTSLYAPAGSAEVSSLIHVNSCRNWADARGCGFAHVSIIIVSVTYLSLLKKLGFEEAILGIRSLGYFPAVVALPILKIKAGGNDHLNKFTCKACANHCAMRSNFTGGGGNRILIQIVKPCSRSHSRTMLGLQENHSVGRL